MIVVHDKFKYWLGVSCALLLLINPIFSQNTDGISSDRLPKKGNINFGINAVPILQWAGNIFNGNVDNNSIGTPKFRNPLAPNITIKYALQEKTFLRITYGGNSTNHEQRNLVFDDSKANDPNARVIDVKTSNRNLWALAAGIEKRRSNGNLQGFFGADIVYSRGRIDEHYKYGNNFDDFNQTPTTTTDFVGRVSDNVGKRLLSTTTQNSHEIGLRAFIGAEYFFTNAISLGAEFGYTLVYQNASNTLNKYEIYDAFDGAVKQSIENTGGSNTTATILDNQGGSIMLNFYF